MPQSRLLELAHEKLHWPTPKQILAPSGAGPSVYARIAKEKLGKTISELPDGEGVQVGILAANPLGDSTEAPIAIVCNFQNEVSEETLKYTYKLAWSFTRSPSLITIEPSQLRIWTCYDFRFPRLRQRQLINADFFQEDKQGFLTNADAGKYDLVIGNAPWGEKSMTLNAKSWAIKNNWKSYYKNIGLLFLPKAATLTKQGGKIVMMQPALALLFNQVSTAKDFRAKLFSEFKVEEIVNLSALRFGLFKDAISPACIITLSSLPPDGAPLTYICPKPVFSNEDYYHLVIEPNDINIVYPHEAAVNSLVWT